MFVFVLRLVIAPENPQLTDKGKFFKNIFQPAIFCYPGEPLRIVIAPENPRLTD